MNGYEMGVRRGEIHFVKNRQSVGSEISNDRPCIIVSNNRANEHSPVIEVVYMTTQPKKDLSTHVYIDMTSNGRCEGSIVLCEQIHSISKSRLKENSYIARVSDEDMEAIDEALMISLGLDDYIPDDTEDEQPDENVCYEEPEEVEEEEVYEEYEDDGELAETIEKLKMAEMERNFYKQQYEMLLDKIMNR